MRDEHVSIEEVSTTIQGLEEENERARELLKNIAEKRRAVIEGALNPVPVGEWQDRYEAFEAAVDAVFTFLTPTQEATDE